MKVIFMGSGEFACYQLKALHESSIEVLSVVTQPKKEVGRKKELKGTPVYDLANSYGYEVYEAGKSKEIVDQVDLEEADFVVVADYGVLLKEYVLSAPKVDCINVHGSILPEYRGASPIQSCLYDGRTKTGVTIMRMVKAMDAGAVYKIVEYEIQEEDVAPVLYKKLAEIGGAALVETLNEIFEKELEPVEQDDSKATYCGKIKKEDALVVFEEEEARKIWDKYRAYYFWPKIYFIHKGKRYIIHECSYRNDLDLNKGEFAYIDGAMCVGTLNGELCVSVIQPEGKKPMDVSTFWRGYESVFV
jgi:methionyl-tRNA formyltransferase